MLALLTIVHMVWRHHVYLAFGSVVMLALLVAAHGRFTVRSDPRGVVRGLVLMVITLAVAILWGTVTFYLLDHRDFGREFGFGEALVRTLRQFVFIGNTDLVPLNPSARWFLRILSILGVTAAVLALFSVFRPVAFRLATLPQEQRRAQNLVAEYGASTYDYFKVWPDKSLYFPTPDLLRRLPGAPRRGRRARRSYRPSGGTRAGDRRLRALRPGQRLGAGVPHAGVPGCLPEV